MDNCEHVLGTVAELVGSVVTGCPTVTVMTTSREPLGVQGERVHPIPALDPISDGVELFCDRAMAADETFTPSDRDRVAIGDICRRLDGLPLAIELAAARIRSLSPTDILAHLDDRFRLLHASGPGRSERSQTLRATVTWSYRLLTEQERLLFDRVSVFAGGFDLSAAEAVCADDIVVKYDILDLLGSLVDKSMVVADRGEDGVRYRLLETLRQYGDERLGERADTARLRDRHLARYGDVAQWANQLWVSPGQIEADATFDREWDNLRAAHTWAVASGNLAGAGTLVAHAGPHAWCRMRHEHGDWAERTLALDSADQHPTPATYGWAAYWMFIGGEQDRAIDSARHGIEVAPSADHPDTTYCWSVLVWAYLSTGRGNLASEPAQHAQVAAAGAPDAFARAWAFVSLIENAFGADVGSVADHVARFADWAEAVGAPSLLSRAALYEGEVRLADEHSVAPGVVSSYREGLDLALKCGDKNNEGKNLVLFATAAARFHAPDANEVCREALARLYDTRHWTMYWLVVEVVARWLGTIGDVEGAAVVYGFLERHHPVWDSATNRRARRRGLTAVRQHVRADQLMAAGAAMHRDDLVAFVLDRLTATAPEAEKP